MQKIFLMTLIMACLSIPVRRARRQKAYPLGRVITDFVFYSVGFSIVLRFFFGQLG